MRVLLSAIVVLALAIIVDGYLYGGFYSYAVVRMITHIKVQIR